MQFFRKPRLILSLIVFLIVGYLLWSARGVLAPFAVALVIGYVLLPAVNMVEERLPAGLREGKFSRTISIFLVYAILLLGLYLFARALLDPLIGQLVSFINNLPDLADELLMLLTNALEQYQQLLSPEWQAQIEQQIGSYNPTALLNPLFTALRRAVGAATGIISSLLGLIILPFWLYFILSDDRTVVQSLLRIVPHEWRADVEAVRIIVDVILGAYLRGQLAVASILGIMITIGLTLIQVPYALLLGVATALFALVPFAGAFLGAIPAVLVALLESPQKALITILLYIVVQQIDNILISPKIIGEAVALHPALIILVLLIGGTLFGVPGALIAVPGTAMLRDIVSYLYLRADEHQQVLPTEALAHVGYEQAVTARMLRYERQRSLPLLRQRRLGKASHQDEDDE